MIQIQENASRQTGLCTQPSTGGPFINNQDGNVVLTGTQGNDTIKAWQVGTLLKVSINNGAPITLDTCAMRSFSIFGAGGTDTLNVDSSVIFPIQVKDCKKIDAITIRDQQLGGYQQIVQGRVPQPIISGDLPPPPPSQSCTQDSEKTWQQVASDSSQQLSKQMCSDSKRVDDKKTKELERALDAALATGDLDMAVLLVSMLETQKANESMTGILGKIRDLQQQRQQVGNDLGKLGSGSSDASKANELNNKAGSIATDISLLQTFLQETMSQKQEAQQMASNLIKSRHDTNEGVIRNMA